MNSVLKMNNISKTFPGVNALSNVDLEIQSGEVHALMGENGAGKSTLMKILSGVYQQTEGTLLLNDQPQSFVSPKAAEKAGIAMIHQEFNLFPNLTVAENIFIERTDFNKKTNFINWKKMNTEANNIIASLGANIEVTNKVQDLSVQSQQVTEIAKAISIEADVLIMDEPSAALPESEVKRMFEVVETLKARGVAIIYVSHRLPEVFQIADRVTILRDGKKVDTKSINETTEADLINMMVGKEISDLYPEKKSTFNKEDAIVIKNMKIAPNKKVNFTIRKGEIIGLFGLIGSGTHNVAESLFGTRNNKTEIVMNNSSVNIKNPKKAVKNKVGYVPPDRHRQGLITQMSVRDNMSMSVMKKLSSKLGINKNREIELVDYYIKLLNIKTPNSEQIVSLLSGGNQQKIVLSKWLAIDPKLLILEEPTRGVDVGSKAEIYELIQKLADEGVSILLITTEMQEVLGMADQIHVMRNGEIVDTFQYKNITQNQLLSIASNSNEVGEENEENFKFS